MAKKKKSPIEPPAEVVADESTENTTRQAVKIFVDAGGRMPTRSYEQDAGIDLYTPRDIYIEKHETATMCLSVRVEIPSGYCGILHSRSSVARDKHLVIIGGVIDAGYRGPIHLTMVNPNIYGVYVRKNERVAQLVVTKIECPMIIEIDDPEEFSDAQRGEKGLGSTGT